MKGPHIVPTWGGQTDRDRVLEATDLIELVGEHIPLRRRGREHVGVCPFHDDNRPSLTVVTHKGHAFYKCFACGAAGNAIDFVMAYHKKDFREALEYLAHRAGITLSRTASKSAVPEALSRDALRRANAHAARFFRKVLRDPADGEPFRRMLEERRIDQAMIEAFQIGAAPDRWDGLLNTLRASGLTQETFLAAGLLKRSTSRDGCYDAFRNRLIFPICDELSAPIAFGGRGLGPGDEPKYLNSAESALFDKSATLFALHLAKRSIIDSKQAIVTEGYTDVIACHQAGVTNVIGTLGTALTDRHARALGRLCDTVVLVFDGDEAGQRAADRAVAAFFHAPVDVKICTLPGGADPDDLLRQQNGKQQFLHLVGRADDALAFKIARFRAEYERITSVAGRQKHLETFLRELADLGFGMLQGVRKRHALTLLADGLALPLREVEQALLRCRPRRASGAAARAATETAEPDAPTADMTVADSASAGAGVLRARRLAEHDVLAVLIYEPALGFDGLTLPAGGDERPNPPLAASHFQDPLARRLAELILPRLQAKQAFTVQTLLDACGDESLRRTAADLYFAGERRCGQESEDPPAVVRSVLDVLGACMERARYQHAVSTCAAGPLADEEKISMIEEMIRKRRQQGDLAAAIAQDV